MSNPVRYNSEGHKLVETVQELNGKTRSAKTITKQRIYHDITKVAEWDWTQKRNGKLYADVKPRPNVVKEEGELDEKDQRHGVWNTYLYTGDLYESQEWDHGVQFGLYTLYWRRKFEDNTIGPTPNLFKYIDCMVDNKNNTASQYTGQFFVGKVSIYDNNKVNGRKDSFRGNIWGS